MDYVAIFMAGHMPTVHSISVTLQETAFLQISSIGMREPEVDGY